MNADSGLCEGCLRTLDEIAAWSASSDAERQRINTAAAARVCVQPQDGAAATAVKN